MGSTTVNYLDKNGNTLVYTLINAQVVQQAFLSTVTYAFLFQFTTSTTGQSLYLAVPFDLKSTFISTFSYTNQALILSSMDSSFSLLQTFSANPGTSLTNGLPLSAFNFLASLNYN
jgi:hypothetical protein